MTAGDITSTFYVQDDELKDITVSLSVGTWASKNAADPPRYALAVAGETDPAYPVIPKNVTGEAEGQAVPSMLVYDTTYPKVSLLKKGKVHMIVQSGVTLFKDDKVKVGTTGFTAKYVDGTDTDYRLVKGICRSQKVVGNGVLTAEIEVGTIN
jgi:hypothetical protein